MQMWNIHGNLWDKEVSELKHPWSYIQVQCIIFYLFVYSFYIMQYKIFEIVTSVFPLCYFSCPHSFIFFSPLTSCGNMNSILLETYFKSSLENIHSHISHSQLYKSIFSLLLILRNRIIILNFSFQIHSLCRFKPMYIYYMIQLIN